MARVLKYCRRRKTMFMGAVALFLVVQTVRAASVLKAMPNDPTTVPEPLPSTDPLPRPQPGPANHPPATTAERTLALVQLIARHGDRTPTTILPIPDEVSWENTAVIDSGILSPGEDAPAALAKKAYIPGRQVLMGDSALGILTDIGKQQTKALGARLREAYIEDYPLLPETLEDEDLVYARSTDVSRTHYSAYSALLGLYPPETRGNGISDGGFTIWTIDAYSETMWVIESLCPKIGDIKEDIRSSSTWVARDKEVLQPLLQEFRDAWGVDRIPSLGGLFDALRARIAHGHDLPAGVTNDMWLGVADEMEWQLRTMFSDPRLRRLGLGTFLTELLSRMEGKMVDAPNYPAKIELYFGHDSTVGPLAGTLGLLFADKPWYPDYAGNLILELWEEAPSSLEAGPRSRPEYWVRALRDEEPVQIPGCADKYCPYAVFLDAVSPYLPEDLPTECEAVGAPYRGRYSYETLLQNRFTYETRWPASA